MRKNIILFVTLIATLLSCKKNSQQEIIQVTTEKYDTVVNLSYQELSTDFLIAYPSALILIDSHLIIQDNKGHDFYYHAINRNTGLLEYEFGKRGNGPGEILSTSINPLGGQGNETIQIFDSEKRELCYFNDGKNVNSQKILDLSKKFGVYLLNFFDLDSCYLATGVNSVLDKKRFVVIDKTFDLLKGMIEYPILNKDKDENEHLSKELFNIYFFKFAPNKKKAVFASYKIGFLEIFDLSALPRYHYICKIHTFNQTNAK